MTPPREESKCVRCPACSERPAGCRECDGTGAVTATRWMELEMAKKKGKAK